MMSPQERLQNLSENALKKRENQIFKAYSRVCIVAIVGTIFSLCFFLVFLNHNIAKLKDEFQYSALLQISALESRLSSIEELASSIQAFYASSQSVTKEELKTYTSAILVRKNVNFISWMRLNYESRGIDKLYISAKVAENEQKAVDFIFDNKVIKDAAEEVSRTGKIKVSLPFTLPYMDPEMNFVALVVPVSSDISKLNEAIVDENRFFNVVTVVLNITQTLRNTLLNEQHERSNIEIMLSTPDISGRLQELLLYEQKAEDYGLQDLIANPYDNFSQKLAISKSLNFGSSIIKVVIQPSYAYLSDATKTGPWIAFLLGIILTIFAGYWVHLQISQTIKIQDIVHDRTKELKESNKALDDFVYIVSHDLKEPLRGIYAFSEFLLEDYEDKLDEDGVNKLQTLKKLASRMEDLIETLLQYSRLGRTDLAFQRVKINEVISNTLELIEPVYEHENVHIRVQQDMPSIYCDTARVSEIFRNLIVNGIKYNDSEEKIIEIGCTTKHPSCEGCLTFFIKDNGIGIDEERHDDIFKMFKRLHGRDEYGGGTGSGLPIVKKIIERHNGRIWVEKNAEGGSSFFFTLQKNAL